MATPGQRGLFDRLAQRASYFSRSPLFFVLCVALVLAWLAGYVFNAGNSYEQALGTALTAVTLLLVALLKNAELRSEAAIQNKLDALATGMLEAIRDEASRPTRCSSARSGSTGDLAAQFAARARCSRGSSPTNRLSQVSTSPIDRIDGWSGQAVEAAVGAHHRRRLRRAGRLAQLDPPRRLAVGRRRSAAARGQQLEVLIDGAEALPAIAEAIAGRARMCTSPAGMSLPTSG